MSFRPTVLLSALAFLAVSACGDDPPAPATDDAGGNDATGQADITPDATDPADTTPDTATPDTATPDTTDPADATPDAPDGADTADGGDDGGPPIDPTLDRDEDGLPDLDEVTIWGTSPVVADTDGDGFSDKMEAIDLAFDPTVNNFQFNPLVADRPTLAIDLALAPLLYATYETSTGTAETIGQERSSETRNARSRSWGGSNSYAVEQSHTVGVSVGFDGWSMSGSVSYEYSYSTTNETTSEWSEEQATENARTLAQMREFEESNTITTSGGVLAITARLRNPGNIAYFVGNLALTAYEIDPLNPEDITPVGTLTFADGAFSRTRLDPGESSAPLVFSTDLDLPSVRRLLADSRNLMIAPATWVLEGDGTVNFELASTAVNARTAEVIIDYGFARPTESYRVSTVANEDRNYITVDEALRTILRIPYEQGTASLRRTPEGAPEPTREMLTRVRDFGTSDDDATLWTVVHAYPINDGADTRIDRYHPMTDELDFGALRLQKGHSLQLIRIVDVDRDGLGERAEYAYGTDPNNPDTDGDGCTDGFEVAGWWVGEGDDAVFYRSDPTLANTDGDLYDDCEEYARGTDPMDSDNTAPTATLRLIEADGVRAVVEVDFADAESDVVELRYTVDDGAELVVDVRDTTSPYLLELVFDEAGTRRIELVASDGVLLSEPARLNYTVGAYPLNANPYWPITGSTDSDFSGFVESGLHAEFIRFVTGRDGTGRGAAHTSIDGSKGLLRTEAIELTADFSASAWIRFDAIFSSMAVFGQDGRFAVGADTDGISLHDLSSNSSVTTSNRIARVPMGGSWTGTDAWYLVVVTVEAGTATLHVGPDRTASGPLPTPATLPRCVLFFGQTRNGNASCFSPERADDSENPLRAAFDDLRIFPRPLSANEVRALWLD